MADSVEVRHAVDHQDGHGGVDEAKGIATRIEEENVGQAQHQPGHRHGQHGHELGQRTAPGEGTGFLQQVGAHKHHHGADGGGPDRQLQRVPVGRPAIGVEVAKGVVLERQLQVVGPVGDERGPHRHRQQTEDQAAHHSAEHQQAPVAPRRGPGHQRHRARAEQGHLAFLDVAVDPERQHRRQQQHKTHHRAHLEILLAYDLLEDIGRQHIEAPANHLGDTEIGDDHGEDDEAGADDAVPGAGQRHRKEHARFGSPQRVRRFVQTCVGHGQRSQQNHEGVWKTVENLRHHDAEGSVDRDAKQPVLQDALVAEDIDHRDRGQQRGRQDGDQRQRLEQTLAAHAAALQGIGVGKGQRQHDGRGEQRHPQAVPHRGEQRGRGEVLNVVGHADEPAVLVLETLGQQPPQGQYQRDQQPAYQHADAEPHQQVVTVELAPRGRCAGVGHHAHRESLLRIAV